MRFMGLGTLHGRLSGGKIIRIMYDIGNLILHLHVFVLGCVGLVQVSYKWLRSGLAQSQDQS
jgi:hypothetical protein